jgi:hypothetical protein
LLIYISSFLSRSQVFFFGEAHNGKQKTCVLTLQKVKKFTKEQLTSNGFWLKLFKPKFGLFVQKIKDER